MLGLDGLHGLYHCEAFYKDLEGKIKRQEIALFWLAIVLSIWLTRNNYIFNGVSCVLDDIVENIKLVSWSRQATSNKRVKCPLGYNW